MNDPYKIILSPRSLQDLVEMHQYVAEDSPDAAAALVGRILEGIDLIAQFPL